MARGVHCVDSYCWTRVCGPTEWTGRAQRHAEHLRANKLCDHSAGRHPEDVVKITLATKPARICRDQDGTQMGRCRARRQRLLTFHNAPIRPMITVEDHETE